MTGKEGYITQYDEPGAVPRKGERIKLDDSGLFHIIVDVMHSFVQEGYQIIHVYTSK